MNRENTCRSTSVLMWLKLHREQTENSVLTNTTASIIEEHFLALVKE